MKKKKRGNTRTLLSKVIPRGILSSALRRTILNRYKAPDLVYPFVFSKVPNILVILPENPLSALHQISGCLSLITHFKTPHVTIVCCKEVAGFFKSLEGIERFIEYDIDERYLFSKRFAAIGKEISRDAFDICVLFEPKPDISLLYIVGQSAAKVRIGYADSGDFPFLNFQVRPSQTRVFSADKGLLLVSMLGASLKQKMHWTVSKEAREEATMMLQEMNVPPDSRLIGIDGGFFVRHFGRDWTKKLIATIKKMQCVCYVLSYDEQDPEETEWLLHQNLPVFQNVPIPRSAAIINKSEFFVAGPSVMFELADLLKKPVIGIFTANEFDLFCKETSTTHGIRYSQNPDQTIIDEVEKYAHASQAHHDDSK